MKRLFICFFFIISVLATNSALAFRLFVENLSNTTMIIQHETGSQLAVAPGSFIEERFSDNTIVRCLIKQKEVCSWNITKITEPGKRLIGIGYGNYGKGMECATFTTDIDD